MNKIIAVRIFWNPKNPSSIWDYPSSLVTLKDFDDFKHVVRQVADSVRPSGRAVSVFYRPTDLEDEKEDPLKDALQNGGVVIINARDLEVPHSWCDDTRRHPGMDVTVHSGTSFIIVMPHEDLVSCKKSGALVSRPIGYFPNYLAAHDRTCDVAQRGETIKIDLRGRLDWEPALKGSYELGPELTLGQFVPGAVRPGVSAIEIHHAPEDPAIDVFLARHPVEAKISYGFTADEQRRALSRLRVVEDRGQPATTLNTTNYMELTSRYSFTEKGMQPEKSVFEMAREHTFRVTENLPEEIWMQILLNAPADVSLSFILEPGVKNSKPMPEVREVKDWQLENKTQILFSEIPAYTAQCLRRVGDVDIVYANPETGGGELLQSLSPSGAMIKLRVYKLLSAGKTVCVVGLSPEVLQELASVFYSPAYISFNGRHEPVNGRLIAIMSDSKLALPFPNQFRHVINTVFPKRPEAKGLAPLELAVKAIMENVVSFYVGGPGVGKSTAVEQVAEALRTRYEVFVYPAISIGETSSWQDEDLMSKVIAWASDRRAGIKILRFDEINLKERSFLMPFLEMLFSGRLRVGIQEFEIDLGHKLVFTGNLRSLPGRHYDDIAWAARVIFPALTREQLKEEVVLPKLREFQRLVNQDYRARPVENLCWGEACYLADSDVRWMSDSILFAHEFVGRIAPEKKLTVRDLQDAIKWTAFHFVNRSNISEAFTRQELIEMSVFHGVTHAFGGFLNKSQLALLKRWLDQACNNQYGDNFVYNIDMSELRWLLINFLNDSWKFREIFCGYSKSALVVEGEPGAGKTWLVNNVLSDSVDEFLVTDAYDPILQKQEAEESCKKGRRMVLSEANHFPAAVLEGIVNGPLTCPDRHAKFRLFMTVNSAMSEGCHRFSDAFMSRVNYFRLDDLSRNDLEKILTSRNRAGDRVIRTQLLNTYFALREVMTERHCPIRPSPRDVFRADDSIYYGNPSGYMEMPGYFQRYMDVAKVSTMDLGPYLLAADKPKENSLCSKDLDSKFQRLSLDVRPERLEGSDPPTEVPPLRPAAAPAPLRLPELKIPEPRPLSSLGQAYVSALGETKEVKQAQAYVHPPAIYYFPERHSDGLRVPTGAALNRMTIVAPQIYKDEKIGDWIIPLFIPENMAVGAELKVSMHNDVPVVRVPSNPGSISYTLFEGKQEGLLEVKMESPRYGLRTETWPELHREISGSGIAKLRSLEDVLKRHFRYVNDAETAKAYVGCTPDTLPAKVMEVRKGVCHEVAHLFYALTCDWGFPARLVSGRVSSSVGEISSQGHAWVNVFSEGRWHRFDPTPMVAAAPAPAEKKVEEKKAPSVSDVIDRLIAERRSEMDQFVSKLAVAHQTTVTRFRRTTNSRSGSISPQHVMRCRIRHRTDIFERRVMVKEAGKKILILTEPVQVNDPSSIKPSDHFALSFLAPWQAAMNAGFSFLYYRSAEFQAARSALDLCSAARMGSLLDVEPEPEAIVQEASRRFGMPPSRFAVIQLMSC